MSFSYVYLIFILLFISQPILFVCVTQWMEVGLAGALGLAAVNLVEVDDPFVLAPARVLPLRTEAASVQERRTRLNPVTPDPAV